MSLLSFLLFFAAVLLVLVVLTGYLWWRLVRSTTRPGRVRRRLTVLTVVLALLPLAAQLLTRFLPAWISTPLAWVGFTWLGVALYLFLALVVLEPVRLVVGHRLRRRSARPEEPAAEAAPAMPSETSISDEPARPEQRSSEVVGAVRDDRTAADLSRRLFLARSLAATAGAVAVGTGGTGMYFANAAPVVQRVPIALPGLDPRLDGFRIVTFSDGHLSWTYGRRRFERLVELVNEQEPDVVAVVGDLVDGEVDQLRKDVAPMADLVSKQGVFFVTGNHEYFVDTQAWLRHLPTLGVQVLRNERVPLRRGAATFDLAGIDDVSAAESGVPGHGANLTAALDGRDGATPVVLLAHQPVQVEQAAKAGVDLQLSGHTHGGQIWPFDYVVGLNQPVLDGLHRFGNTQLYVTRGAGYWGPPMRIGARPEITVIELKSPNA